jgi:hypothetical protein
VIPFLVLQESVPWPQLALYGPTVVILAMILWFLIRAAPTWTAIKGREFEVREMEASARAGQAEALKAVGGALNALGNVLDRNSEVLENVAVEQRHATEAVRLSQRVTAASTERLRVTVKELAGQIANDKADRADREDGGDQEES